MEIHNEDSFNPKAPNNFRSQQKDQLFSDRARQSSSYKTPCYNDNYKSNEGDYEFLGQVGLLSNSVDQSIVSGDKDYSRILNQHSYEL